jgi:hypothetical protein
VIVIKFKGQSCVLKCQLAICGLGLAKSSCMFRWQAGRQACAVCFTAVMLMMVLHDGGRRCADSGWPQGAPTCLPWQAGRQACTC